MSVSASTREIRPDATAGTSRCAVYPTYRPSGVACIDDVPAHWTIRKVAHAFRTIGSGTTPASQSDEYYAGDVPWVTTSELRESIILDTTSKLTAQALKDHTVLRLYPPGTLLFAMYGATIGRLGMLGVRATVNQACCALGDSPFIEPQFAYYWFQMRRPVLIAWATGGGQPNLSQDDLREVRIPTPPLDEQRAIAAFLDRETVRIDALIAKKQRLIELLQEKRAAVVARTVRRGLKPGVPLTDSRIDWLGHVPSHWALKRLGYLVSIRGGCTPDKGNAEYWNGDVPWVTPKDMKVETIADSEDHVTSLALRETGLTLLTPPAVLIVVRGMILAHTIPIARLAGPVTVNQDMKALTPTRNIDARFLAWMLRGCDSAFFALVEESGHGTRVLRTDLWMKATFPLPPLPEQIGIAAFLDNETAKLDELQGRITVAIDRLREYRSALISAAVTGKIDVRNSREDAPCQ